MDPRALASTPARTPARALGLALAHALGHSPVRAAVGMPGIVAAVLVGTLEPLGCGGAGTSDAVPQPVAGAAQAVETPPPSEGPYRYRQTLADALADGELAQPIVELAIRDRAELRIVAAVARPGAEPVIELWRFDQRNDKGTLIRVEAPEVILRWDLAAQPDPEQKVRERLRVELATPGSDLHRALGIPAARAADALARMAAAAQVANNRTTAVWARLSAISLVAQGLDNDALLTDDLLAPAIAGLAGGGWAPAGNVDAASDRRAAITTADGTQLELLRKASGWVITHARRQPASSTDPAAEPSPTAPRR